MFLISLASPCVVAAQPIDIGVVSIDSPSGTGSFGVSEGVTVTVKNFGVQNVSNFVLQLAADDKFLGNQSFFVSLMPGQEASVVFSTTVDLSGPGEHTIFARTTVAGDGDPTNDIATATVTTSNPYTTDVVSQFPYFENFEAGAAGWQSFVATDSGFVDDWELGTPNGDIIVGAASGSNSWVTNLDGVYSSATESQVVSPVFDLGSIPLLELSLNVWWESPIHGAGAQVQVSHDNGETWETIGEEGEPENWYTSQSVKGLSYTGDGVDAAPGWAGYNSAGSFGFAYFSAGSYTDGAGCWTPAKHTFKGGSSTSRLRIAFGSDQYTGGMQRGDDGFGFDDIGIKIAATATRTAALVVDVDSDGFIDPGDTVEFTSVISNTSSFSLSGTTFSDSLTDTNLDLLPGSVSTTFGSVTSGNGGGDTSVGVNIGTLASGSDATIVFRAVVGALSSGEVQVCAQGATSASAFGSGNDLLTDNPATSTRADTTCVGASIDSDSDGVPDTIDACPGFDDSDDMDSDGVPDGCDQCENDSTKSLPGVCGCGTAEVDLNGNSIVDCIDAVVNTDNEGFCLPGQTDCVYRPLRSDACVVANGFLEHVNITSVINLQSTSLNATVQYFDGSGVKKGEVTTSIGAQLKKDFIINDLGLTPNTVGTVCVLTDGDFGSWTGANIIYRPDAAATAGFQGFAFGDGFEYALFYPFENEFRAPVGVPLNTFRLGANPQAVIGNWISIADALRDGNPLFGRIFYYDNLGQIKLVQAVFIADGGRSDFAGHEGLTAGTNAEAIGSAVFVPDTLPNGDPAQYYLTLTRYFYDCPGASCSNFLTAYNIGNRPATSNTTYGGISTVDGQLSVIELTNYDNLSASIEVDVFDEDGTRTSTTAVTLPGNATQHFVVGGSLLPENSIGSAAVRVLSGKISAASVFYQLDSNGVLQLAYSSPFVGSPAKTQLNQFNSFISHVNPSEISNGSSNTALIQLQYFNSAGTEVLTEMFLLPAMATRRATPSLPVDNLGTIVMSADQSGVVFRSFITRPDQYSMPVIGR